MSACMCADCGPEYDYDNSGMYCLAVFDTSAVFCRGYAIDTCCTRHCHCIVCMWNKINLRMINNDGCHNYTVNVE